MRWQTGRRSGNIEDRRGRGGRGMIGGGIGAVVIALVAALFGIDPGVIGVDGGGPSAEGVPQEGAPPANVSPEEQRLADFTSVILGNTEDVWNGIFQRQGREYQEPRLVLFSGATQTGCGFGQAAMGPFYCPTDNRVYIDLSFYRDMQTKLGAPGDFAQAYVIAHEVGHHVQNQLGISDQVHQAQQRTGEEEANQLSVRLELQADCFSGVWANHADNAGDVSLEQGDIEEGLNAAAAVGDDRLQKQSQGYVVPEAFTHGSSEQRMQWFQRGFQSGDPDQCDTFNAARL